MKKRLSNKVLCRNCADVIESTRKIVHGVDVGGSVSHCTCGQVTVGGGIFTAYVVWHKGEAKDAYRDLSEYEA